MKSKPKAKPGDLLFHGLTTLKRGLDGAERRLRYSHPPPKSAATARELAGSTGCVYTPMGPEEKRDLALPGRTDPQIRHFFERISKAIAPERFVLELRNGRVYGEGHVITAENRLVRDVSVYFSQHEKHWLLGRGRLPDPVRVDGTVAVLASTGSNNYFHWTFDTLPRIALLQDRLGEIDRFYVGNAAPFQREWLERTGIPAAKILPAGPRTHIQAERLLVPSFSQRGGIYARSAFDFIRGFMPPASDTGRRIFVSRSHARRRRIVNEEAIEPILAGHGYETHRLAGMTVAAQIELFGSATHVVSTHGAELTNLVYCRPGTKVLEIFSPYYVNLCYWSISAQLGLDYGCMLGRGGERHLERRKTGLQVWRNIRIDPERFGRNLEILEASHG